MDKKDLALAYEFLRIRSELKNLEENWKDGKISRAEALKAKALIKIAWEARLSSLVARWRPPSPGNCKINLAGEVCTLSNTAVWSCIIRDSSGRWMASSICRLFGENFTDMQPVVESLYRSLDRASYLGLTNLEIESETENLVRVIATEKGELFELCKKQMMNLKYLTVRKINKKQNVCAQILLDMAKNLSDPGPIHHENPPDALNDQLQKDLDAHKFEPETETTFASFLMTCSELLLEQLSSNSITWSKETQLKGLQTVVSGFVKYLAAQEKEVDAGPEEIKEVSSSSFSGDSGAPGLTELQKKDAAVSNDGVSASESVLLDKCMESPTTVLNAEEEVMEVEDGLQK